jgi:MFS family permease
MMWLPVRLHELAQQRELLPCDDTCAVCSTARANAARDSARRTWHETCSSHGDMEDLRRLVFALASAAALLAQAPPAHALESESAAATEDDPALRTALAMTGLGGASMIASAVLMTSERDRECGLSGCHPVTSKSQRDAGVLLLGAGVGLTGAGALAVLGVLAAPVEDGHRRAGRARMVAGLVMTCLGAAAGGLGNASMLAVRGEDSMYPVGAGFISSGVLLAVGIPLLATGARTRTRAEAEALERQEPHREFRSEALMWTGGVMLAAGAGLGIAGLAMVVSCDDSGPYGCLGTKVAALAIGVPGAATHVGGAVLLGLGSTRVPPVPEVEVGPATLSLSWRLE